MSDGRVALVDGHYIPVALALICIDCEMLFRAGVLSCPACGSEHLHPVARFIDREREDPQ
jgi:rRNA maturation endonuclease Nob1